MTEQRYVEAPVTWVGYQWDGEYDEIKSWVSEKKSFTAAISTDNKISFSFLNSFGSLNVGQVYSLKLGDWLLYSPELNEFRVATDDQFHRQYTAKI